MTDVDPTAEPIPAAPPVDPVVEGTPPVDAAEVVPGAEQKDPAIDAAEQAADALAAQEAADAAAHLAAQEAEAEAEAEAERAAHEVAAIAGVDPEAAAIPPQGLEVPDHPEPEIVIVGVKQDNVTQPGTELTHTLGSQGYVTSAHETSGGTVKAEPEPEQ